jgi:hypothetical protein
MITFFCDFRHFLPKKWAFCSKTNVMIKNLHYLAMKNPLFLFEQENLTIKQVKNSVAR